ncbi:hypothetical protein [Anaeromyxobacter sp. SG66]|uniref:hypothetical protein n=1 Tax=Anaeromyxobacter sp. SG66 TaxID=2925410 RepID=UPI001F57B444|nr:hypothetical protein [Anaeromyxobacter sp. SG66]
MIRALPWLAALVPAVALAQAVSFGAAREPGGAVLGRVCVDLDGDGRCGADEPGVAGARVLSEDGAIAIADGRGGYHLLEVPGRIVLRDRTAYGGHLVTAEGLGASRAFELGFAGAAAVDLAVPSPRAAAPTLEPAPPDDPRASRAPPPRQDGRLGWTLDGRAAPGATVTVAGVRAEVQEDGTFHAEVELAPGDNAFPVVVRSADGGLSVYSWTVQRVARARGGDLVLPVAPVRVAALAVGAAAGGGVLVLGSVPRGARVVVAGIVPAPLRSGAFAAFAPPGAADATLELRTGHAPPLVVPLPLPGASGLRAGVALAELELSLGGDAGFLVTARGAGTAAGRAGPVEYAAGLDLDDREGSLADLARPRDALAAEHALDPERTFLTAGDDSAADDRNPGRGRIWARVEAPGARLDLGKSRAGLTGAELGRYDRALFGAKARGERELGPVRVEASAFGATLRTDAGGNAPPQVAHDVLAATGGAFFWLSHGEIVPGSEAVRVEWRDPLTGLASGGRVLVRSEDYEVDWASGRIVLAHPLSSAVAPPVLATGEPFSAQRAIVVVDYQHAATGPGGEDLAGGRVGAAAGPLTLAVHGANEERAGGYRLAAGAASLDLGAPLLLRAEAARSRGTPFGEAAGSAFGRSADGGIIFAPVAAGEGEAGAVHVEAQGAIGPGRYAAWWREREAGYVDFEFAEPAAARERGVEAGGHAGIFTATAIYAEREGAGPAEEGGATPNEARRLVGRGTARVGGVALTAEAAHARLVAPEPGEETSAGVRASWRAAPGLSLDLSHHQGLAVSGAGRDPTFTAAGATVHRGDGRLSVRGGWGPELGPRVLVGGERGRDGEAVYGTYTVDPDAPSAFREAGSALGARRRAGATEVFTEEQLVRDALGLRAARVVGASVSPLRGFTLTVTGERGARLRPDGSDLERSGAGGAAALVRGPVRLALRGEARRDGGDARVATGGAAEWRALSRLTLSTRAAWAHAAGAREALAFEAAAGAALRLERAGILVSLARLADQRPGAIRRDALVGRLAGTADVAERLSLGAGAAIGWQRAEGVRDERASGSVRAVVRVGGPLDVGAEYARRASLEGLPIGDLDAVRAEAGVRAGQSRIALGYTFLGFSGDGIAPRDDGRIFLRAQLAYGP